MPENPRRVGILYQPKLEAARALSEEIEARLASLALETWRTSAWDDVAAGPQVQGSDLIIGLGGDGTLLRAARLFDFCDQERMRIHEAEFGDCGFNRHLLTAVIHARYRVMCSHSCYSQ